MKLTKIEIRGLFDLFDYDIPLTNEENLLIITGPNGFGKTMILNIIDSLFNNELEFFLKLVFKKIVIDCDNRKQIVIQKKDRYFVILYDNKVFYDYESAQKEVRKAYKAKHKYFNPFMAENIDTHLEDEQFQLKLDKLFFDFQVHLIKEQRLLKIYVPQSYDGDEEESHYTIEEYAKELGVFISEYLQESYSITQQIDSSFPKRLLNEKGSLTIEEFDKRFKLLKNKQAKLNRFGLSESEQEIPEYNEQNANVLLVYLKDSEEKIKVFDSLVDKLELFSNILNERRFTFKSIKIDRKKGFIFLTKNGKELKLIDLSSGEQHEVVLLYELIFKTNSNTLVLIDEPEISLHVTWQKEFLSDLLKILELQKMQVIVATHSPQIINDKWDLVFNLETQTMQ
jgi:predicted ATP-binding protein involved in virulence